MSQTNYSHDTSGAAYKTVKPLNRDIVFEAIKKIGKPCTDKMIADTLGWKINCITGRRGELKSEGRIRLVGKWIPPGGKTPEHFWEVASPKYFTGVEQRLFD